MIDLGGKTTKTMSNDIADDFNYGFFSSDDDDKREVIEDLIEDFDDNYRHVAKPSMCDFFDSVTKQYRKRHTLSDKQIGAMKNIINGIEKFHSRGWDDGDIQTEND